MPIFDVLGDTLNPKSWEMHTKLSIESGKYFISMIDIYINDKLDLDLH